MRHLVFFSAASVLAPVHPVFGNDMLFDMAWDMLQKTKFCTATYGKPLSICTRDTECADCVLDDLPRSFDGYVICSDAPDYLCTTLEEAQTCPCVKGCEQEAEELVGCFFDKIWCSLSYSYIDCDFDVVPAEEPVVVDGTTMNDQMSNGDTITDGTTVTAATTSTNSSNAVNVNVSRLIITLCVSAVLVLEML